MIRFPDLIEKSANKAPDKLALHFEGRDFTWQDYHHRTRAIAAAFSELGVALGDRIAFLGQNSHWLIETYFAPAIIGAISVPLNYRLADAELIGVLNDATPKVLIVDRHYADRAQTLMDNCPSLQQIIFADWEQDTDGLPAGTLPYDALVTQHTQVPPMALDGRASASDDTILIFYTSGTTGRPKGVMLSHGGLLANALCTAPIYGADESDVLLLTGPLFHLGTGGRVFTAVAHGTSMVVQSQFDVEPTMQIIAAQKVTAMTLVPTMLRMILDHPNFASFDFSSVRRIAYGTMPMPSSLLQRVIELFPSIVFFTGYGMTEAGPVVTILPPPVHLPANLPNAQLKTVGRPVATIDLRIVDENGDQVPTGTPGEIVVRGAQVMNGYWQNPQETAHAMRGGFYHTGDAGFLNEDGYLTLVGRTKEMIISGGENVYPIETENALCKHPAVAQAAVFGVPHKKWGEMVFAVVSFVDGRSASDEELVAFCRQLIAGYKLPRGIHAWDGPLPLSATNKINKAEIRARILDALESGPGD